VKENLIHNERIKLGAAFLSNIGAGVIVAGVLAPLLVWMLDNPPTTTARYVGRILVAFLALGAGLFLSWFGRHVLEELRDE
jgi:hypothetical protein